MRRQNVFNSILQISETFVMFWNRDTVDWIFCSGKYLLGWKIICNWLSFGMIEDHYSRLYVSHPLCIGFQEFSLLTTGVARLFELIYW